MSSEILKSLRGLKLRAMPGNFILDGKTIEYQAAVTDSQGFLLLYMTKGNHYFVLGKPLALVEKLLEGHDEAGRRRQ